MWSTVEHLVDNVEQPGVHSVPNMVTTATANMITTATTAPCKRGHTVPRTTRTVNGRTVSVCPTCVREDKRTSAARRRAKMKEGRGTISNVVALRPEATPAVEPATAPAQAGTFLAVANE